MSWERSVELQVGSTSLLAVFVVVPRECDINQPSLALSACDGAPSFELVLIPGLLASWCPHFGDQVDNGSREDPHGHVVDQLAWRD